MTSCNVITPPKASHFIEPPIELQPTVILLIRTKNPWIDSPFIPPNLLVTSRVDPGIVQIMNMIFFLHSFISGKPTYSPRNQHYHHLYFF